MAKTTRATSARSEESTPTSYPEITPPRHAQHTHDFTLQAIMELQKTVGQLGTKVERLIDDVKEQRQVLDEVRIKIAWAMGAAAVVGVLFGVVVALSQLPWSKLFTAISDHPAVTQPK